MKTEIISMQIIDDDGDTVLAKIECFDDACASVEVKSVYTVDEWREIAAEIDRCLVMLELKTDES